MALAHSSASGLVSDAASDGERAIERCEQASERRSEHPIERCERHNERLGEQCNERFCGAR
jgi:hypothetical protein